ncbi:MAG: VOC family protein [Porticoccaceae bacterium]
MSRFFGKAVHSAYVVPDIKAAVGRMVSAGVGPAYYMNRIRVAGRYRGERNDPLITAAFMYSGSLQFEFIQQHDDTPSAYLDFLAKNPEGGFHHTAYYSSNFTGTLEQAEKEGQAFDVIQEFIAPDGTPYEIYVAPRGVDNPLYMQLMFPGPMEPMFTAMENSALTWDGQKPERDALDLLPPEMRPPQEF